MLRSKFTQRVSWCAVAAAALLGRPALGEEPPAAILGDPIRLEGNVVVTAVADDEKQQAAHSMYWIGVSCDALPAALQSQLALQEGLLIQEVRPESPAATAGIHQHDILLRLGERKVTAVEQLVEEVNRLGGKEVDVLLLRGGREVTVKLVPTARPEGIVNDVDVIKQTIDAKVRRHFDKEDVKMLLVRPGVVMPPGHAKSMELPKGVSITIRKEGDKPAKIEVKRDDQSWSVNEDKLDDLPGDLRPLVEQMQGHAIHLRLPHGLPGDAKATRVLGFNTVPAPGPRMTAKAYPPAVHAAPAAPVTWARAVEPPSPQLAELSNKLDQVLKAVQKPSEVESLQKEVKQLREELNQLRKQIEK